MVGGENQLPANNKAQFETKYSVVVVFLVLLS